MSKIRLVDWKKYLYIDLLKFSGTAPSHMRSYMRQQTNKLLADDAYGWKLFLASRLGIGTKLPVVPTTLLRSLHLIYLLSWLSYGIYDDINDGENREQLLPTANYCIFAAIRLSQHLSSKSDHCQRLLDLLSAMELANDREMHLSTKQVYPRALLHQRAKGQLFAVYVLADHWRLSVRERDDLLGLMQALLSILQMQDDLRDWELDWRAGRSTMATQSLLSMSCESQVRQCFYCTVLPSLLIERSVCLDSVRKKLRTLSHFDVQDGFFNLILSYAEKILINDQAKSALLWRQYCCKELVK